MMTALRSSMPSLSVSDLFVLERGNKASPVCWMQFGFKDVKPTVARAS